MLRFFVWTVACFLFFTACTGDEEDSSLMDGDTSDGDSDTPVEDGDEEPLPDGDTLEDGDDEPSDGDVQEDGDEPDGDEDDDEEEIDWVAFCSGFGEEDCPETDCLKFVGWFRRLNRELGCFNYVSSYSVVACAPGELCEEEGVVALSPGRDCIYLQTCSVPEIEGWINCSVENPSDPEACRACTTSCDDLTDGDGASPCYDHGHLDPRNGRCLCDSENMTEDCSACLDGFGEYPDCDTPLVWTDPDTGLMWMNRPDPRALDQMFTVMACASTTWAGYEDWRLPGVDELRSLIRGCPATEPGGSCCPNGDYPDCHDVNGDCNGCAGGEGPNDGCYWPEGMEGPCTSYWTGFWWQTLPLPDYVAGLVVSFSNAAVVRWDFASMNVVRCVRIPTSYSSSESNPRR